MSIIRQGKSTFNTGYPATEVAATTAKSIFMDFLPCPSINEVAKTLLDSIGSADGQQQSCWIPDKSAQADFAICWCGFNRRLSGD